MEEEGGFGVGGGLDEDGGAPEWGPALKAEEMGETGGVVFRRRESDGTAGGGVVVNGGGGFQGVSYGHWGFHSHRHLCLFFYTRRIFQN